MKRKRAWYLVGWLGMLLMLVHCGGAENPPCAKDTDCKGELFCSFGRCVAVAEQREPLPPKKDGELSFIFPEEGGAKGSSEGVEINIPARTVATDFEIRARLLGEVTPKGGLPEQA